MSYSKEETERVIAAYTENPNRVTVSELAIELERSERSIIGKLSIEKVYQKKIYTTKLGENPVTKLDLVSMIEDKLGLNNGNLSGLEKSPKSVLQILDRIIGENKE